MNDRHNTPDRIRSPGSNHDGSSSGVQLSANTARVDFFSIAPSLLTNRTFWQRARLEKLAGWRIDPALLRFSKRGPNFKGGCAIVSRAVLVDSSDGTIGNLVEPSGRAVESCDPIAKVEGDNGSQLTEALKEEARKEDKEEAEREEQESDDEAFGGRKVSGDLAHPASPANR